MAATATSLRRYLLPLRLSRPLRHLSTSTAPTSSLTIPPSPPIPSLLCLGNRRPSSLLVPLVAATSSRIGSIRCRVNRTYSPLTAPVPDDEARFFPGCDYKHWLILTDKPGGEDATKEQMIEFYIETLAKVVGSVEEAKKKIYKVSWERYFGFGCEIDEETSKKLEELHEVLFVIPDFYVDVENQDYGGKLLVDGVIVKRSPERERRVQLMSSKAQDKPRYNDRARYVRQNQRQT